MTRHIRGTLILDPDILELIGHPRRTAQDAADELLEAVQPTRPWLRPIPPGSFAARFFATGAIPLGAFGQRLVEERAAKPIRFADLTTY